MLKKKKNQEEETPMETPEVTPEAGNNEEIAKLTAELEKSKAEAADANDRYLRLYAEFDNFKRRTSKERMDLLQTAGKEVIVSMLPVIDDFERALRAMETAADVAPVIEGVNLVSNKLKNILQQKGLKEMTSKGELFNPDLHEAITNIPAPTDDLKGKVIDEVEKGYYLNDKVIRFAKVLVGA